MAGTDREANLLRHQNRALVADLLRRHQPISRVQLADLSRLGRSTITGIVGQLMAEGLAVEVGEAESTGGRKPVLLELAARARLVVCARISTRAVALGLADLNGQLVMRQRRALRGGGTPREVLGQVSTWTTEMLREYGADPGRVIAGCLVVPGRVSPDGATVLSSAALGWHQVEAGSLLSEQLGIPFFLETDAYAFVRGEQQAGAVRQAGQLLGITAGAGVGAGLILDGRLCRGTTGGLGEIGHVIVDPEGPACWCGRRGCLEALVSDGALVAQALAAIDRGADTLLPELVEGRRQAITREVIVAAAQDGDRLSIRLLDQAGHRLGAVAAQLATALSPTVLLLGGEALDQAGELLMRPICEALQSQMAPWVAEHLQIVQAKQGETAFLAGAAARVLDQVFAIPEPGTDPGDNRLNLSNWLPEEL